MNISIVPNEEKYYSFIKELRLHPLNIEGFIDQSIFDYSSHIEYMKKYKDCYYVALIDHETPVGFGGVVDNDIRVSVHPNYKKMGVGKSIISYLIDKYPNAIAKIKYSNIASIRLFESCGFDKTFILMKK
jgi:hypothetical protein